MFFLFLILISAFLFSFLLILSICIFSIVIDGHGQTLASDFWSLGCLMYELLIGVTPFSDPMGNLNNVHGNILQGINDRILGKMSSCGQLASEMVEGLLQNNAENRLGAKSFNDLQQHLWFSEVDVNMLELNQGRFSSVPEWIPTINSKQVGSMYYVDGQKLKLEDVVMNGGGTVEDISGNSGKNENRNELAWHWVF